MVKLFTTVLLALLVTPAFAADPPKTEDQKILYAIGLSVARSLAVFDLSPKELEFVQQGISDTFVGKTPDPELLSYNAKIQVFARDRRKALGEKQRGAGTDFLEKSAREKGAVRTASGMVYTSLADGKGESPKASDVVNVNYRGTFIDGKEFDSSFKRGKPLEFKLDNVIACWIEGIQMMKPGGKAKFVCPPNLAYGENGAGELILPGATLAFEVELLGFKPAEPSKPGGTAPESPVSPAK